MAAVLPSPSRLQEDILMRKRTGTILVMVVLLLSVFHDTGANAQEQPIFSETYKQVIKTLETLSPGDSIQVDMGTEKDTYNVGDSFEMRFRVSKDSYVTIMHISTSGDILFFAPNSAVPEVQVEGQRVYSTLYDFNLPIEVAPPGGYETINLFCSPKKIDFFQTDFDTESFYEIKHDDESRLKDLQKRLEQLQRQEWSGNSVTIEIKGTRAFLKKAGGALPPIGSTGTSGKFFPPIGSTGTAGKSALPPIGSTGTSGRAEKQKEDKAP